jgi:hypothetical protein
MLAPDKNMALALTRRAMTDVPWSSGMSHTKTRPGEAGAALSSMKGGIDPVPGTDGILPSDRSSAIGSSRPASDQAGHGPILRGLAEDGYRMILKNACSFPDATPAHALHLRRRRVVRNGAVARGGRAGHAPEAAAPALVRRRLRVCHGWPGCAAAHNRRIRSLVFPVLFASIVSCLHPARACSVIRKRENPGGAAVKVS